MIWYFVPRPNKTKPFCHGVMFLQLPLITKGGMAQIKEDCYTVFPRILNTIKYTYYPTLLLLLTKKLLKSPF